MQIPPSIKDFLAVIFALLYLLSPLNKEILEISHLVSHKISKTFTTHTHAHSHPGIPSHKPETHEYKALAEKHSHHILEFISRALNISDKEQVPVEKTKKETYDKHIIGYYYQIQHFKVTLGNTYSAYIHKNYSIYREKYSPPPEPGFHIHLM